MTVTTYQDLPLADRDRKWDGDAADARVREWADAEQEPTPDYRDAHVWYDGDAADNFGSYKLLIADVVDGRPCPMRSFRPATSSRAPAVVSTFLGATSSGSRTTSPATTRRWATPRHGKTRADHRPSPSDAGVDARVC